MDLWDKDCTLYSMSRHSILSSFVHTLSCCFMLANLHRKRTLSWTDGIMKSVVVKTKGNQNVFNLPVNVPGHFVYNFPVDVLLTS